jgi:hypothetical protein
MIFLPMKRMAVRTTEPGWEGVCGKGRGGMLKTELLLLQNAVRWFCWYKVKKAFSKNKSGSDKFQMSRSKKLTTIYTTTT